MSTRHGHIDALKLIGSQLIVLHHLSAYGPVADAVEQAAPAWMRWLYNDARMAVQVFLVLGGYLAAQSLTGTASKAAESPGGGLGSTLLRRYLRLILPFMVAMALAIAGAGLARQWLDAEFIPAKPSAGQLLAHATLLHGVLGAEALSAGVWYVAIDFQLFALMALLLGLGGDPGGTRGRKALLLVLALMMASLFHFNRDARWDNWAIYFFGAYGLGAAAYWAANAGRPARWLSLLAMLTLMALVLDFRGRLALALVVALLLGLIQWRQPVNRVWPPWLARPVHALGRSSYALFLVHFPVLVVGNALFALMGWSGPAAGGIMLLAIWSTSVALGWWFERWVEAPLSRWVSRRVRSARLPM